jgi:hypothetical protein
MSAGKEENGIAPKPFQVTKEERRKANKENK